MLSIKALVLNVIPVGTAYWLTALTWQHGFGTKLLLGQTVRIGNTDHQP